MTRNQLVSFALTALVASLTLSNLGPVRADHVPGFSPAQVDSYLQTQMRSRGIPGLSVVVVRDGSVILQRSYGVADVEQEAATSPGSVYEIGSLSKQFTAAAIMLLHQDGKLRLFDPIRAHLPELPESWANITVRHLLTHTSGIPSYTSVTGFWANRDSSISKKQVLDSIAGLPLRFVPGERWLASTSDYFVLGMLVERVSGLSYSSFLTQRIFRPLGMAFTGVNDYTRPIKNRVEGYMPTDGSLLAIANPAHPSRLFGHGALVSSPSDMARWEVALSRGTLLRPASLAEMWRPMHLSSGTSTEYGFGWYVHPSTEWGTIIEHAGANTGFRSQIIRYTGDKTTVILFANLDGVNPYTLADGVHRIISGPTAITR